MAKTIITSHNEMLRTDRMLNPERFTFTRTRMQDQDTSAYGTKRRGFAPSQAGRSATDIMNDPGEIKQVTVKTANKLIRTQVNKKKGEKGGYAINDDDNDEITLDYVLGDIIGSTLAEKMGKNDPEYKNFKESFDHTITYFIDRFTYISDELIHDVFT